MRFLRDNRAQSIQIGAVLLFGVLIVLLATWQAFVIPDQNEEVEFTHNEDLQQQLTDLRSTTNSMPNTLTTQSVTLDLGLRYPTRTIFRNPPPVSGTVETVGTDDESFNLTITNAEAVENNVADFWDGTDRSYGTGAVEYRPNYNLYDNAPETVYEHSVLFNRFPVEQQTLSRTGQALVRDDRITVVAVDGDLQEDRVESASVDIEPISTDTRSVEIAGDGGPVTIELVTGLAEPRWRTTLREEFVDNGGNIESIETTPLPNTDREQLEITLQESESYTLQMAKVGFGTGATETTKTYLTDIEGTDSSIQRGASQRLTVEVRDRFNNPKRGIQVNASAEGGGFQDGEDTTTVRSDSDGQATVRYTGQQAGENNINFTISDGYEPEPGGVHDERAPENVRLTVEVNAPDEGGEGAYDIAWDRDQIENENGVTQPSEDTFDYDATVQDELELPIFTDPVVDGATVDYAVSNQQIGTVGPVSGTTDAGGEDFTTFDPRQTGEINVFTSSGGSGDRIAIEITNIDLGLSGTAVTDIIQNADEQMQAVRFTIEDQALGGDHNVTVDLNAPQSDSADYGNEDARVVAGGGTIGSFDMSEGKLRYDAPTGGNAVGDEIEIWIQDISVESESNELEVLLDRSDIASEQQEQFDVTRDGRDVRLDDITLSNLVGTDTQEQTVEFTPDGEFGENEVVTIELGDAQAGDVDYGDADAEVTSGGGEVDAFQVDEKTYITYVSPDTGSGDPVEITIEDVTAEQTGGSYEAGISRGSAGTDAVEFDVLGGAIPELSNLQIDDDGSQTTISDGEDVELSAEVENIGDEPGEFTINLDIENGETVSDDTTTANLDTGDSETVTFAGVTDTLSPDVYDVTVEDSEEISSVTGVLTVEDATDVAVLNAEFGFEERTDTQLNPITVEVEDANEEPVGDEDISLDVTQGDGNFLINGANEGSDVTVTTDSNGEFEDTVEYSTNVFPESVEVTLEDESGDVTETISYEVTAPISGTVQDENGNGIGDADITVTNTDTGDERTTQTASDGTYSIEVPVGTYDVEADADGFNPEIEQGVGVDAGGEGEVIDFTLGSEPSFGSLSAAVTDYNQGQDAIRAVSIDGSVENVDNDGFIDIEFTGDVGDIEGDTERQIGMAATFDEPFDTGSGNTGPGELGVIIRLLDEEENPYVACTSNTDLTDGGSELSLDEGDFSCD